MIEATLADVICVENIQEFGQYMVVWSIDVLSVINKMVTKEKFGKPPREAVRKFRIGQKVKVMERQNTRMVEKGSGVVDSIALTGRSHSYHVVYQDKYGGLMSDGWFPASSLRSKWK